MKIPSQIKSEPLNVKVVLSLRIKCTFPLDDILDSKDTSSVTIYHPSVNSVRSLVTTVASAGAKRIF